MKSKDLVFKNENGEELISFTESSLESKSWPDIKKYISSLGNNNQRWVFRGITDSEFELTSSLERIEVAPSERVAYLNAMLGDYSSSIHNYLREGKSPDQNDYLELLTLMHQHGAPANLLEWSHSPYVASYFAIDDIIQKHSIKKNRCCIWALNQTLIHNLFSRYIEKFYKKDLVNPEGKSYNNPNVFKQIFEMLFDGTHGFILPVQPLRKNLKLISQQGTYTYIGNPRMDFQNNLANLCKKILDKFPEIYDDGNIIRKISFIASDDLINEIRHDLLIMNISSRTLFPGIEGFTKSLKCKTLHSDDEIYRKKPFYSN